MAVGQSSKAAARRDRASAAAMGDLGLADRPPCPRRCSIALTMTAALSVFPFAVSAVALVLAIVQDQREPSRRGLRHRDVGF